MGDPNVRGDSVCRDRIIVAYIVPGVNECWEYLLNVCDERSLVIQYSLLYLDSQYLNCSSIPTSNRKKKKNKSMREIIVPEFSQFLCGCAHCMHSCCLLKPGPHWGFMSHGALCKSCCVKFCEHGKVSTLISGLLRISCWLISERARWYWWQSEDTFIYILQTQAAQGKPTREL